ncbi:transposase [Gordonia sp. AC31]|uniref:transposase n=1 Tax=Gordonia TaxID=2053 RepID=UPI0037BF5E1B
MSDALLANSIRDIHEGSRGCYGAPRVHAELRLGAGVRVGRKRVARVMRILGLAGIGARHKTHQDLIRILDRGTHLASIHRRRA